MEESINESISGDRFMTIKTMLSSFISPEPLRTVPGSKNPPHKTSPNCKEAFKSRLETFSSGNWSVFNISPLVCAQRGWIYYEEDILQCCTCKSILCTKLPSITESSLYHHTIETLKQRIKNHHKKWCGWRNNSNPEDFLTPPKNLSVHQLQELVRNTAALAALKSELPKINTNRLLQDLNLNAVNLQLLYNKNTPLSTHEIDAALLTLSGWTCCDNLRHMKCNICQRLIRLGKFKTNCVDEKKGSKTGVENRIPNLPLETTMSMLDIGLKRKHSIDLNDFPRKKTCVENQIANLPVETTMSMLDIGVKRKHSMDLNDFPRKKTCPANPNSLDMLEFNPLEEHRFWCSWITRVEHKSKEIEGFHIIPPQLKRLTPTLADDLVMSDKYAKITEGLKAVRCMLNDSIL